MNNLFKNISPRNQEKILKILEATNFTVTKNVNIFTTNRNENFLALVVSGNVQIINQDYNGDRFIIEDLKEGDIFGSMISSLKGNDYEVISKEETNLILIDYERIFLNDNKTEYYNQFLQNLIQIITLKIEEKNERIEILTKKTIRNKLLEYFKILNRKMGTKTLYLPISFTELADYLAVDRCAMSRELRYLKEEGFIKVSSRRITLLY